MNRHYRTLWNPSLDAWVAAPETATARVKNTTSALQLACLALVAGLALPLTALAASGAGGGGGGNGWDNDSSESLPGAGAVGGKGGDGGGSSSTGGAAGAAPGDDGSDGADGEPSFDSLGGGAGGGSGASAGLNPSAPVSGALVGGNGGNGGKSSRPEGDVPPGFDLSKLGGGGGGGGGAGVRLTSGVLEITESGIVRGGNGGDGGQGGDRDAAMGGGGAGGGAAGIVVQGAEIANRGKISGGLAGATLYGGGGSGGAGEGGASGASASGAAQNGAGVIGSNFTLTNHGVIEGGITGADESTRANSITFTGGVNKLVTTATGEMFGAVEIQKTAITTIEMVSRSDAITNRLLLNGVAVFDLTEGAEATWSGNINGAGHLIKNGVGALTISGKNDYQGNTTVTQGVLRAGAANTFSAQSAMTVNQGATLDLNGHSQALLSVVNAGTVSLVGTVPGTTLMVNGPWTGSATSTLVLGTKLGDATSATDRLILSGPAAIATDNTQVVVKNLDGLGAQTQGLGIKLVEATAGARIADEAFTLSAPVAAGAFIYKGALVSGTAEGTDSEVGFYLKSDTSNPSYREEVSLYAALPEQLRQANSAMLANLHQRVGGFIQGEGGLGQRQAWGRMINTDRSMRQNGTVSPSSHGRLTGFQTGTDLWANASWRTGLYVGQLEGDMAVKGFVDGVKGAAAGSNHLRHQYLAAYLSWQGETGAYADAVLQAGRHRYTATGLTTAASAGKGDSRLVSLELGKNFALGTQWNIEPQLQLVHQQLQFDAVEMVGAQVQRNSHSGWQARVGLRMHGNLATSLGGFQPFARVNVYKAGSGSDRVRFIGPAAATDIQTATGGTSLEMAAGGSLQLSPRTALYGELGKIWARGGDSRVSSGVNLSVGLKLRW